MMFNVIHHKISWFDILQICLHHFPQVLTLLVIQMAIRKWSNLFVLVLPLAKVPCGSGNLSWQWNISISAIYMTDLY